MAAQISMKVFDRRQLPRLSDKSDKLCDAEPVQRIATQMAVWTSWAPKEPQNDVHQCGSVFIPVS